MKADRKRIRAPVHVQRYARELRRNVTPTETALWLHVRGHQLNGLEFRRQHPLGPFIADLYCAAHRLVVEIGGGVHDFQTEHDSMRTEQLEVYGYRVIRFRNEQVTKDLGGVLAGIRSACFESRGIDAPEVV